MNMTFHDLVSTPVITQTRVDQMVRLLPEFEIGIKNGHSLQKLCEALSVETNGPFCGSKPKNIMSLYYRAKRKAGND